MTRQNVIHKEVVEYEQQRKSILKAIQRNNKGRRIARSYKNRKWWKQFDKDFNARWRKEHNNA